MKQNNASRKPPHRASTDAKAIIDGIQILNHILSTCKSVRLNHDNNEIVQSQLHALLDSIQRSLSLYNDTTFLLKQNALFFNGIKLKFSHKNYRLFTFITEEFQKKDIGILRFHQPIHKEELLVFVHLFFDQGRNQTEERTLEELIQELLRKNIRSVTVDRLPSPEMPASGKRETAHVYFLGITHLKEIFKMQEEQKAVPLLLTKRLIQTIFSHLSKNESFMAGLTTIKNFDDYTLNHSVNVCVLSLALGKQLGLQRKELVDLGLAAFFHDMGKLEIPKDILLKPGRLDKEERSIIEKHASYGAGILSNLRNTSHIPLRAINVALEHHSSETRNGYPKYVKKESINLFSKIVQITDVFDALTTKRPYRKKDFTREEALGILLEKAGTEFDPLLVKVFIKMMSPLPVGTLVLCDTGEIGIISELNADPSLSRRPRILIITNPEREKIPGKTVDLADKDPATGLSARSIVTSLDPSKYGITVSDYFMAEVL